jgi:hypothetical protein
MNEFDVDRLVVSSFDEVKQKGKQKFAYIRYNYPTSGEGQLKLQTNCIKLDHHGIPPHHDQYANTEKSRAMLKLPLYEGTIEAEALEKLDEKLASDKFKEKQFGKSYKKFSYSPSYKTSDKHVPYMKIKLNLLYDDDAEESAPVKISTRLYEADGIVDKWTAEKDGEDSNDIKLKYARVPETGVEKIAFYSLEDFNRYVRYKSVVRVTLSASKLWVSNTGQYGVTWKAQAIAVEPRRSAAKASGDSIDFADMDSIAVKKIEIAKIVAKDDSDDDDDSDDEPVKAKQVTNAKQVAKANDSDDDSDDDSDSDESVKPAKKPIVNNKVVAKKAADSDDSDSDESVKPAKKAVSAKKVEDDSSDDEEVKAPPKKSTKKVESDDDSEEEVKKKPSKAAATSSKSRSKKGVNASV